MMPPTLQRLYQAAIAYEVSAQHAHALRNMVGGISASTFFLRRRLDKTLGSGSRGSAEGGTREGERATSLDGRMRNALDMIDNRARDLVALASTRPSLPATAPAQVVLAEVVTELLTACFGSDRIRPPKQTAHTGFVARDELEVVLYCLVENALDAGGTARIRLEDCSKGCRIEVIDDGPGIDAAIADEVLRPFVTTKEGRLGMGLAIADRIASRWGDGVILESTARGTRAAFVVERS